MIRINLKDIAESQGYNISTLQKASGLDLGVVRRYWHGDMKRVELVTIDALCEFLNVEIGDLLVRDKRTN